MGGRVDGLGFNLFHEQVSHSGADAGSYDCPMHLFIILTLGEERGVLRHKSNSVVMCCVDMNVLVAFE